MPQTCSSLGGYLHTPLQQAPQTLLVFDKTGALLDKKMVGGKITFSAAETCLAFLAFDITLTQAEVAAIRKRL